MRHRSNHARVLSRLLLVAALGLLAGCAHMRSGSATAQLDAFMQQERAWAGLTNHTATLPDGRRMPYSEGGPANAPTLILLHGYTGDRNHWNEVARDLTDRWHVIIPDLPGHGGTPLADDASADGMAQTLGHFVDSIGAQRYVLVGHSMGGGV
ncbi:alpha/beta fold hydrolase, partial [uncultured Salinisphaera sp.]|uniref:alpha/beta fold hydrolase n=1 Tax=uncultured Salinisphaera sp. TaxID=359372 RepID=UPI0032B1FCB1